MREGKSYQPSLFKLRERQLNQKGPEAQLDIQQFIQKGHAHKQGPDAPAPPVAVTTTAILTVRRAPCFTHGLADLSTLGQNLLLSLFSFLSGALDLPTAAGRIFLQTEKTALRAHPGLSMAVV